MRTRTLLPFILSALLFSWMPLQAVTGSAQTQDAAAPRILTAREVFETWKDSVFTIKTDRGIGTGFAIGSGILTCYHVVKDAGEVSARVGEHPEKRLERVLALDEKVDATYFSCPDIGAKPVEISDEEKLSVGDPLYVIGSPQGLEHTLTEGILSAKRTINGLVYYQLSAAVSPGSSGSPVFDRYGKVVGMVVATMRDAQQLNFAISMASIWRTMQLGFDLKTALRPASTASSGNTSPSSPTAAVYVTPITAFDLWDAALLARSKNVQQVWLGRAPDFSVAIRLDETAKSFVSEQTVRGWVLAELARSAPAARVLTREEQNAAWKRAMNERNALATKYKSVLSFDFSLQYMDASVAAIDQFYRTLYVYVYCPLDGGIPSYCQADATFMRGAILVNGITVIKGWQAARFGYFGFEPTAETRLREAVTQVVRDFCNAWVAANKEAPKASN